MEVQQTCPAKRGMAQNDVSRTDEVLQAGAEEDADHARERQQGGPRRVVQSRVRVLVGVAAVPANCRCTAVTRSARSLK